MRVKRWLDQNFGKNLNPIPRWRVHAKLHPLLHSVSLLSRRIHAHIWNFLTYTHIHILAKFHGCKRLCSWPRCCLEIKTLWSRPLTMKYATEDKVLIYFNSKFVTALIMIIQLCWENGIAKNYKFCQPPPPSSPKK